MALIIDGYEDLTREELLQRLRDQERAARLQAPPIKAEDRVKSERGVKSEKSIKRERDGNSFDGFPVDLTEDDIAPQRKRSRAAIDLTDD